MKKQVLPKEICVIVTYRCNARCNMCNVWQYPTNAVDEITPAVIDKLPGGLDFVNITGGEPFIRQDIAEIIKVVKPKTKRIVISTNGFFTERIIELCEKYPDLGIRISIEGLPKTNDTVRGIKDGFDHGMRTLLALKDMGVKDIGFGMTVQDVNCGDLLPLYQLSEALGYEFATATLHNSQYFHKYDNKIGDKDKVCHEFAKLVTALLKSSEIKKWFRAYLNYGLMNYIHGNKRLLPCGMSSQACFLDPVGDIMACNGMLEKLSMGNLKMQTFEEIWNSAQAEVVRRKVAECTNNCWMTGSAVPAMKKNLIVPAMWVLKNKIRVMLGKEPEICFNDKKAV